MRKLVLILIVFIAVVTIIRAVDFSRGEEMQKISRSIELNISN